MLNLRLIEMFLIQVIIYLTLWFIKEYVAFLLSSIFTVILLAVLIISGIAELIDRSKVSKRYFLMMIISILAPICSGAIYLILTGSKLDFSFGI